MADDRPRYGLAVSALGAVVLAIAVFLPWYGVSLTAGGVALAQQVGDQVAQQYGNAALQSYMSGLHASFSVLAGHEVTALSAHQALKDVNVVLLVLAGLAILFALIGLVGPEPSSAHALRGPLALLGAVAATCVVYRMIAPPTPSGGVLALSLREGAWLALLGCIGIVAGALWPVRRLDHASATDPDLHSALSALSGWTPES